ncbi:MAG TPA: tRNA (adenine(22)-N(1))-methyltransferase TrmK [Candidatus Binatia bacterium]|nr:tRNA (adenine(22)-N(1))-methyltransferase TrmK [Candidatus Binatia bacterium]
MSRPPLRPRLAAVAAAVPPGAGSVVDVGAGDGQLALEMARRGLRVVATERTPAALARLRAAAPGLDCRLGDGLAPLSAGEVEGAIVAGLGGRSIARLLARARPAALGLRWLVLQPQDRAHELERGLEGYAVCLGAWAVQGRRLYRVIRAVQVSPERPALR